VAESGISREARERKRIFLKQPAKKKKRSTKEVRKDNEEKVGDARERRCLCDSVAREAIGLSL
jgi:hypothetical protein